ncbi:single-stranded DNA-binding protein [Lactococcus lactis]|uniref:single-stranded DNA-binding protein n=1 Tax=Lactococcus lactis TaxID=1358 RepID=UPI00024D9020|nr:single-stranded DNA-binding protein [Lactococcus lactis]BAL51598.1 single-strand binding protein [Lactococcus lactis subsp. lactis IO-1]HAV94765.1 single-stranded DNA-binding protein [Lactococcus lactis]
MINNVVLVGRLTKDVELRYTPQNQATATFSLAVSRSFKNANGERETDFINCVIWRQQAENMANFTHKGSLIGITGRIQTRNYENQQGQRVYVTEVVADSFQLLESRSQGQQQQQQGQYQGQQGNYNQNQNNYQNQGQQNTVPQQHNQGNYQRQPQVNYQNQQQSAQQRAQQPDPNFGGAPMEINDEDLPF